MSIRFPEASHRPRHPGRRAVAARQRPDSLCACPATGLILGVHDGLLDEDGRPSLGTWSPRCRTRVPPGPPCSPMARRSAFPGGDDGSFLRPVVSLNAFVGVCAWIVRGWVLWLRLRGGGRGDGRRGFGRRLRMLRRPRRRQARGLRGGPPRSASPRVRGRGRPLMRLWGSARGLCAGGRCGCGSGTRMGFAGVAWLALGRRSGR